MSALIEFKGFNKFFGEQQVLNGIDLRVKSGEVIVILGPSGCGKSTLLRCLNGLEIAHSGSLGFAGRELLEKGTDWREVRQQIGMVFQSYHLFPHMSVLDNLLLGPVLPLLGLALLTGCNKTEEPPKPKVASESTAPASYLEKIKARDKLIVGVFTDKPPFGFVNEAGRYVGFDTDIGRQFAKDLLGDENKVEFVAVEPASRIPFLQSDKVDLILANMTVTPERKEAVEFTNPNLKVAVQALVPQDSGVKNLDDLATRTTIVTTGTTADIWLTKNHPDWKLLKFEKNSESLQALANGRGDAYAQDNLVLFSWAKQNPGYRVLSQTLGAEAPIAPAVKKGNIELRDWVNAELAKLGEEKYLLKLYDQYVRKELSDDTKPESVIVEGGKWQG